VRRENQMRRMRNIHDHTLQIRKKKKISGDASTFVGASKMCGCDFFSSFLF
jgi:hypothetical protein